MIPLLAEERRTQGEHRVGSVFAPAHALFQIRPLHNYRRALDYLQRLLETQWKVLQRDQRICLSRDIADCIFLGWKDKRLPEGRRCFAYLDLADREAGTDTTQEHLLSNRMLRAECHVGIGQPKRTLQLLDRMDLSITDWDPIGQAWLLLRDARIRINAGVPRTEALNRAGVIESVARDFVVPPMMEELERLMG
jgi:hypothetical protein